MPTTPTGRRPQRGHIPSPERQSTPSVAHQSGAAFLHISAERLEPGARPRLEYLDGLRGVAAVVVVVSHFFCAFASQLTPELTQNPWRIADTPLALLWNGRFAVVIFFLLSGFVVANSAAKRRGSLWARLSLRYIRLAGPVLVSVLFAWLLLELTPGVPANYLAHPKSVWIVHNLITGHPPSLLTAVSEGTFRFLSRGSSLFDVPIWSMKLELVGSMLLYAVYRLPGRWPIWSLTVLAGISPWGRFSLYEGFWLGALLFEYWRRGLLRMRWAPLIFIIGLLLGTPSDGFAIRMHLPHWRSVLTLGDFTSLFAVLAALAVVASLFCSKRLQHFFSVLPCQFLGRISFAMYLLHVPLLSVVLRSSLLLEAPSMLKLMTVWLPLFLLLSVGLGYLGTVGFDEPIVRFNRETEKRFA